MKVLKIKRSAAVALFVALGLKNAGKWDDSRLASKLAKVDQMVDEDVVLDGDLASLLSSVRGANEFTIVEDSATEDAPAAVAAATEDAPAAEAAATEDAPAAEAAATEDAPAAEAAATEFTIVEDSATEDAPAAVAAATVARRRVSRGTASRPGVAGAVLAASGLSKENPILITDEMVAKVNEIYGRENDRESRLYLEVGRNLILGYLNAQ